VRIAGVAGARMPAHRADSADFELEASVEVVLLELGKLGVEVIEGDSNVTHGCFGDGRMGCEGDAVTVLRMVVARNCSIMSAANWLDADFSHVWHTEREVVLQERRSEYAR
jgi:hypothetical protein